MKERIASTVGFEPAAEIVPSLDLVNRFVVNQPLEDERRRAPVDPLQDQKASIEPGSKQMDQVDVDANPLRMRRERRQELPAHLHEHPDPVPRHVEAAEQLLTRRLHGGLQANQVRLGRVRTVRVRGALDIDRIG